MAELRLGPKARSDLDGIFDYTASRWGPDQALLYADLIEAACASLAEAPLRSQDCGVIRPGYRRRSVGQHVIYFRQASYGIAVIRILHQRMDLLRHP